MQKTITFLLICLWSIQAVAQLPDPYDCRKLLAIGRTLICTEQAPDGRFINYYESPASDLVPVDTLDENGNFINGDTIQQEEGLLVKTVIGSVKTIVNSRTNISIAQIPTSITNTYQIHSVDRVKGNTSGGWYLACMTSAAPYTINVILTDTSFNVIRNWTIVQTIGSGSSISIRGTDFGFFLTNYIITLYGSFYNTKAYSYTKHSLTANTLNYTEGIIQRLPYGVGLYTASKYSQTGGFFQGETYQEQRYDVKHFKYHPVSDSIPIVIATNSAYYYKLDNPSPNYYRLIRDTIITRTQNLSNKALELQTTVKIRAEGGNQTIDTITNKVFSIISQGDTIRQDFPDFTRDGAPYQNHSGKLVAFNQLGDSVFYYQHNCVHLDPAFRDLSLSAQPLNNQPAVGIPFSLQITVQNFGNSAATGVVLKIEPGTGLGFESDTSHQASHGTYNVMTKDWVVGTLDANQTATLTLTLVAPHPGPRVIFGRVIAQNEPDIDSSPNYNFLGKVHEDDEVKMVLNVQVVTDSSGANCTKNILKNSTFNRGFESWDVLGAQLLMGGVLGQNGYTSSAVLDSTDQISQIMPAKPLYEYALFMRPYSLDYEFTFYDIAGDIIDTSQNQVRVTAPLGTTHVKISLHGPKQIHDICLVEYETPESREAEGCTDFVFSEKYEWIGYDASGNAIFSSELVSHQYDSINLTANGDIAASSVLLDAPNTIQIDLNRLIEISPLGDTLRVKQIPVAISDSFFSIQAAYVFSDKFLVFGPVKQYSNASPKYRFWLLDSAMMTPAQSVILNGFMHSITPTLTTVPIEFYTVGGGICIAKSHTTNGGFGSRITLLSTSDLSIIIQYSGNFGSIKLLKPGYAQLRIQNSGSGNQGLSWGNSHSFVFSAAQNSIEKILEVKAWRHEHFTRSYFYHAATVNLEDDSIANHATGYFDISNYVQDASAFIFEAGHLGIGIQGDTIFSFEQPYPSLQSPITDYYVYTVQVGDSLFEIQNHFNHTEIRRPFCGVMKAGSERVEVLSPENKLAAIDQNPTLFPNPATYTTQAEWSNQPASFTLTDLAGRVLFHILNQSYAVFDLQPYPSGVYLVRCERPGAVVVKKLVVIR